MPPRRIARWILGVIIGVLLLVVTSALVVETPWFKERLRRIAVSRAAEALNGELSVGRLSGSLWTGVELQDVTLTQKTGPVLSVERIELRYDPRLLIHGHLVFASLRLLHPVVRIAQSGEGWNVATLVKPSRPNGKPVTIQFRALAIEGGQVSIEPASAAPRHFQAVNANLKLSYSSGALMIDADRFTARDRDTAWMLNQGAASYTSRNGHVQARCDLATSAGDVKGTMSGAESNGARRLTAAFDVASLDLAPILANSALKTDVTGKLRADVTTPSSASEGSTIAFQVDQATVSAMGYAAREVRGQGAYGDGVLHLEVAGAAYGAEATARGEWRSAAAPVHPNTLVLAGQFSRLDIRRVPASFQAPPLASQLAGSYEFSYRPSGWDVSLRLKSSTLEGAEIADGTRVRASMRGRLPSYELQGHLTGLDVRRFSKPLHVAILGEERLHSRLTGDVHVTGRGRTLDDTSLRAEASLTDSTVGHTRFPSAQVGAELEGPKLSVRFAGPFEHLDNQLAGLAGPPLDLSGSSDGVRLVFRDLQAPVTPVSLDVDGRVSLSRSVVAGYDIDEAAIDATLANGVADVRAFSVKGADLNATAQGVAGFSGDTASNLSFTVDAQSLQAAADRLGQPLAGAAHVEGRLSGSPDHLSATGSIGLQQFKYGGAFDALSVNGTFGADVVDERWSDATVHVDSTATFVKLAGQDVERMTTKAAYGEGKLDVDTKIEQKERSLELAGSVLFQPEQEEIRLQRLAIAVPNQTWALPAGRDAVIEYGGRRLAVHDLALTNGPERLAVNGALAIGEGGEVASDGVKVEVQGVQLADLNTILSGTRNLAGDLNGTAQIQGTTANPVLESQVTVTNGAVQGTTFQTLTAKAGYKDHQLTVEAKLDVEPGASLTASGSVPLAFGGAADTGGRPLDLRVQSTPINLGVLQAFTTELTAVTGTGEFDVHVTGTPRAPRVNGRVSLAGAGFQLPATGVTYANGNAQVRFDGDHVAIDEFTIQDDDRHTLRIEGGAEVVGERQVQNLDVHIVSDEIHLMRNKYGELDLNADLRATGALGQIDVRGTMGVQRGRFEIDKLIEQFGSSAYSTRPAETVGSVDGDAHAPAALSASDPVQSAAPSSESTPAASATAPARPALAGTPYENATIDVKVRMPDNVILRAQDLRPNGATVGLGSTNLTVGGTLTLDKPSGGNLTVVGGVEVVRGFYDFQGRRFDIGRGSEVQFHGSEPIDPALKISATRDITGITTEVGIQGTARQPEIRLSSQPPLDESDILSLIVFGQPVNSLGESQRINLAQRAGSLALGALAGPLAESVGSALNLDLFEIRTEGESGSPEVSLGSQLGTRAFIGLRQEFGTEDVSVVSFEYRFSHLLRLVTSVAQGTEQTHTMRRNDPTGLDLIYVIRY